MYINEDELFEATSFVCGMNMMLEKPILGDFREWLFKKKLKRTSPFSWDGVVKTCLDERGIDEKKQAAAFLDLLFEFLNDEGIIDAR